ncbi:MAG: redoxin domain-containing protein [Bacteroidales bacterium]|nr:redoxin domain-containing protein [Bacteroidales bacterium]
MKKLILILSLAILGSVQTLFAQYEIKLEIKDCKDSCLILGHYYLDKTYAIDTAWNNKGKFVFKKQDKTLESGIYFFSTTKGKFCELMIDNDKKFSLKTDDSDWTYNMKVKGSETAKIYYEYMKANKPLNDSVSKLMKEKSTITAEEYERRNKALQEYGDSLKTQFIETYPQHLLSKVLKATKAVVLPEFPVYNDENGKPDSVEWSHRRWYYYKQHFFDNIDLSCSGLLRTPSGVFHRSYEYFWNNVMKYESVDSVLVYADLLIEKAKGSKAMSRYLMHNITERYLQSPIMGHDKVYVEMVKRYFKTGKAEWLSPSAIETEVLRAEKWENLLIGKTVPNLACPDVNDQWHDLVTMNHKYKILIFWSPDCGHCSTEIPKYHEFYKQYKETYDLQVMAVNTESDTAHWKKFVEEKQLSWVNVNGLVANYDWRDYFDVVKTPAIYILDRNNVIVAKNIQADNIAKIMELLDSGKLKL